MVTAQKVDQSGDPEDVVDELEPGTKLMHGQYTIECFLNAGGFGITYLARDSLDRKIVIKECFPGAFCRRSRAIVQARSRAHQSELKSIVKLFVQEARSLAKLDHPNIVGVHQVFEDNDTAYMALDFVEGPDMLDRIEDSSDPLSPAEIEDILRQLLDAVGFIHSQEMLHRDISPDNILLDNNRKPVLIDFGAAREQATKATRVLSAMRVVKDGYSPQEFYIAGSEQGPWSDLYALGASFYHVITGEVPSNSQARLAAIASGDADPYEPLVGRFDDYPEPVLASIDKALAVLPKKRLQSVKDWIRMMDGEEAIVLPLASDQPADAGAPKAQAEKPAPEPEKVSPLAFVADLPRPVLMASVAAIALIAIGGIALTQFGDSEAPPVQPAPAVESAPAPAAVETAPVDAAAIEQPAPATPAPAPAAEPEAASSQAAPEQSAITILAPEPDASAAAPQPATSPIEGRWGVVLPFELAGDNVVSELRASAPDWASVGQRIVSFNGIALGNNTPLAPAIAETIALADQSETSVKLGVQDPSGQALSNDTVLPVVYETSIYDAARFQSRFDGETWITTVTALSEGIETDLAVGDVLVAYMPTNRRITEPEAVESIAKRELSSSLDRLTFAVQREGSMWVASLNIPKGAIE
ncbi:serine/threonine protein kinase [Aestuariibius insulae]|uniref:serine/threonine protein kinase n=1 Tax=Aestuariibius insulae TaxID=2058287 RepID=UPI00345EB2FF